MHDHIYIRNIAKYNSLGKSSVNVEQTQAMGKFYAFLMCVSLNSGIISSIGFNTGRKFLVIIIWLSVFFLFFFARCFNLYVLRRIFEQRIFHFNEMMLMCIV